MAFSKTRIPLDREWQHAQQLVKVLQSAVAELTLDVRIINALEGADIIWVKDLVKININDLAQMKNLGDKSVELIIHALGEHGIDLEPRDAHTSNEKLVHQVIAAAEFQADS